MPSHFINKVVLSAHGKTRSVYTTVTLFNIKDKERKKWQVPSGV